MVVKSVKHIIEFVVGAVIGVAIMLGLIVWRASGEPISLAFLTPYLERALSAEDGSFTAKLDDTVLTWGGWERTLDIRLRNVRAIGPQGDVLAAIPEMSISLSLNGLLHGVVAPTRLEIFNPKVRVVRGEDGNLKLGLEGAGPAAGDIMMKSVTDLIAPPASGRAMGYLTTVRIDDADLTLVDDKLHTVWHAPKGDVSIGRDVKGIKGLMSLGLDLDGERADIDGVFGYDRDSRKIEVGLTFANISPARVASKQTLVTGLEGFAVPLAGTLTATMNIDGDVEVVGLDVTGGPGKITWPGLYKEPVQVTKIAFDGRLEDNMSRWVVSKLHAELGGPSIDVTGRLFRAGNDLSAQGEANIRDMPLDALMRYWPVSVGKDARTWIAEHMSAGSVPDTRAVFAAHFPKGDLNNAHLESLAGSFSISGTTVNYLPPMPAVEKVSGRATFTQEELDIAITDGTLRGIKLTDGKVAITGLDVKDQDAAIELVLQGPIRDIVGVLDSEPVGAAKFLGIAPADIGGQAGVRANFKLPLEKTLTFARVDLAAAANVQGASIKNAALHQDLDDGTMTVKVDKTSVKMDGTAKLGGIPTTLTVTENFGGSAAPFRSRIAASARPDEKDLARFGFPVAPYVVGTVPLSLIYTENLDTTGDLRLAADLTPAAMEVKDLGWSKPKGTQGNGHLALALANGHPATIPEFNIAAGNLTAAGTGAFVPLADPNQGTRLQRVDFSRLAFGRTDVAGHILFRDGGGYDVELRGPQIDAADYFSFKNVKKPKEKEEKPPPYAISAVTDTLWLGPEAKVRNASLMLDQADDRWRRLDFQGTMDGDKGSSAFRMTIGTEKTRILGVTSDDAGLFFRTFGVFDHMLGGKLTLTGAFDDSLPDRPFSGKLLVKDYRITNTPFLAKLLTVASLTGIVNVLSGEGIGFSDLNAPITFSKDVLSVNDARAYGTDIGLTMKGTLNVNTNIANLQGTLVPAYGINAFLGKIPIVGDILTGGKGSGVFAATYTVTGNIDDPDISVNPLAALTPGVLRNIFGIFDNGGTPDSGATDTKPDPGSDVQNPPWQNQ